MPRIKKRISYKDLIKREIVILYNCQSFHTLQSVSVNALDFVHSKPIRKLMGFKLCRVTIEDCGNDRFIIHDKTT